MTEQIEKLVDYTNNRLKNWYKVVKEDYGVIGSAKATYSIEHDSITITAIEDGKKLEDCKVSYVSTEAKDYAFNVWSELS